MKHDINRVAPATGAASVNPRIAARFAALKAQKRAGLVTFTMAYDPEYDTSLNILKALPGAGADIIEIGMPFADPMADGPSIAAAGNRALQAGAKMHGVLGMIQQFREGNQETPIILMGYYNPILHYGIEAFVRDAKAAGVDGLIVVDLPPEEDDALYRATLAAEMALVKLITPTTDDARLAVILEKASGFLYYVSVAGITGTKSASVDSVNQALQRFRKQTDLPIVVGFGIKTPEQAAAMASVADAVVVGSALVGKVAEHMNDRNTAKREVLKLTEALAHSIAKVEKH